MHRKKGWGVCTIHKGLGQARRWARLLHFLPCCTALRNKLKESAQHHRNNACSPVTKLPQDTRGRRGGTSCLPHRYMHLYSPAITCTCNPVKSCPLMGGSCTLKGKLESRRRLGRSGVHSPVHWGGPLGSQPCRPGNWCQAAPSPRGGSTCGVVEHAVRVDGGLVGWRRVIGLVDVRVLECGVWGWRVMEVESPAFSVVRKV